jgi:hypothetical protein
MATKVIDISENKKASSVSPIAVFVWVAFFILFTALVRNNLFLYIILNLVSWILTQIFFQFSPRFVFLSLRFLTTNSKLSPSFEDKGYLHDYSKIKSLSKIIEKDDDVDYYGGY